MFDGSTFGRRLGRFLRLQLVVPPAQAVPRSEHPEHEEAPRRRIVPCPIHARRGPRWPVRLALVAAGSCWPAAVSWSRRLHDEHLTGDRLGRLDDRVLRDVCDESTVLARHRSLHVPPPLACQVVKLLPGDLGAGREGRLSSSGTFRSPPAVIHRTATAKAPCATNYVMWTVMARKGRTTTAVRRSGLNTAGAPDDHDDQRGVPLAFMEGAAAGDARIPTRSITATLRSTRGGPCSWRCPRRPEQRDPRQRADRRSPSARSPGRPEPPPRREFSAGSRLRR